MKDLVILNSINLPEHIAVSHCNRNRRFIAWEKSWSGAWSANWVHSQDAEPLANQHASRHSEFWQGCDISDHIIVMRLRNELETWNFQNRFIFQMWTLCTSFHASKMLISRNGASMEGCGYVAKNEQAEWTCSWSRFSFKILSHIPEHYRTSHTKRESKSSNRSWVINKNHLDTFFWDTLYVDY